MFKKILLSLIVFYTFLGFVAIPLLLKSQAISAIEEQTNAKVDIQTIYFNPFMFRLEIVGLELKSLDDAKLLKLKSIILNLEVHSLLNAAIHVKELILEEPEIHLVLDKNKQINFNSIIKQKPVDTQELNTITKMPRIILDKIAVINGSLDYEDYSKQSKFDFKIDRLGFELKDIDTKNMQTNDARLRFYMKLEDGGFFDLKSEVLGIEPLELKGTLSYEASKLYSQWRYVKDSLNLEVADGKLSFNTDYYFNMDDLEATLLSNMNLNLEGLRVKPKGNHKDILTLESFYIQNAEIKPLSQDIHVEKIALKSLYAKVKRATDKNLDWIEYIKFNSATQVEEEKVEEATEDKKPWKLLVDALSLEKIKIDFEDKGVKPNLNNTLNELNIYAQNITLDGEEALDYQMDLLLNNEFKCSSEGSIIHKVLEAKTYTKCSNLDIEYFVPYIDEIANKELAVYNVKLRSLKTNFDANVSIKDINASLVVDVTDANIALKNFALNKRTTNKRLATFSDLNVSGIKLNTASKEVLIADVSLRDLNLRSAKLQDGTMSTDNLIVPHKQDKSKKIDKIRKKKKEKEYRVRLKKFALKGAKLSFVDKTMQASVKAKIDKIYLRVNNIDSKEYSWMHYYLSARVNGSGKLKSDGSLRHTPLKQKGKLSLNRLSLKEITPYLQEKAFVSLDEAYVSFQTKTKYAVSKKKPDLRVDGSFKLEEIFLTDSRNKESLVSFNKINLKEFTLETSPNRFFVNEVDIDSFYVNAMIDANKTMNLASLSKEQDSNTSEDINASKQLVVDDVNISTSEAFPIRIMKVNVKNGNAVFSDASLPINFKTDIHDLNGVIYAISSHPEETSYVDITGDIDKYGSTKLKGSVNASNPKAFTDLDFNFRNLDLSAMSGYSHTFAGHHIDDGKLFLNLNYDIKNSELKGENSVIIKKIKLGKEVEIDGGALPLGFVIALLEDDEGVIDIDMPIRGNVDEPDFKYGALVWKTFGNLIVKAVASPFKFLGSMLGIGGDELEYAEFEAGSIAILASEREKLDNVAKLLRKRPKIILSIGGTYNLDVDKKAMQRAKLISLVVKKSGAKNDEERVSAMTIDLLEDIYEDFKDDAKLDKIEKKLRKKYEGDAFDREYLKALVKTCSEIQTVAIDEIIELAKQRSMLVKSYLVDEKSIDLARIKELEVTEVQSDTNKFVRSKLEVIIK